MVKIILGILGALMGLALIITGDSIFLTPGILCWGFLGTIEAIEKLGQKK